MTTPHRYDGLVTVDPVRLANAHDGRYEQLAPDLRAAVDGEVRFDAGSRATYSTDASNYRQVPIGVVVPAPSTTWSRRWRVSGATGAPITTAAAARASPARPPTSQ